MAWLLLVGIGVIAVSIGIVIHIKSNRSLQPTANRTPRVNASLSDDQPNQTLADQIIWRDLPVWESEENENFEIDISSVITPLSWVELDTEQPSFVHDYNFLIPDIPDDLENILKSVIDTKDLYSQELFLPGEQVYLCRLHKLAYHEDSWIELGHQCPVCGDHAHTGRYKLPD